MKELWDLDLQASFGSSSNVVLKKVNVVTSTNQKILGSKFLSQGYFNYCTQLYFLCFVIFCFCTVFSNASFRGFSFGEPIFVGFVPGQSLWLCPNGRLQSRHGGGDEATPWSLIQLERFFSKDTRQFLSKRAEEKWNND